MNIMANQKKESEKKRRSKFSDLNNKTENAYLNSDNDGETGEMEGEFYWRDQEPDYSKGRQLGRDKSEQLDIWDNLNSNNPYRECNGADSQRDKFYIRENVNKNGIRSNLDKLSEKLNEE